MYDIETWFEMVKKDGEDNNHRTLPKSNPFDSLPDNPKGIKFIIDYQIGEIKPYTPEP